MKNIEILKKYLSTNEMLIKEFAKFVGISKAGMYKIMKSGTIRIDTARKIQEATGGDLKVADFDVFWPANRIPKNNL